MGADGRAFVDRAHAMLEHAAVFARHVGCAVGFLLVVGEEWRGQKRYTFIENGVVAGRTNILGDDVRQPQQVIRASSTKATAGGLVPPVLNVPFDELPPRGAEDMFARERRLAEEQRHHILKLIAKAIRATGLVVTTAR